MILHNCSYLSFTACASSAPQIGTPSASRQPPLRVSTEAQPPSTRARRYPPPPSLLNACFRLSLLQLSASWHGY